MSVFELEANRVLAEPIVKLVREYLDTDGERLADGSFSPVPIMMLAERADVKPDMLQKILLGRNQTIDFDVADRLLCVMNLTELWITDLGEIYGSVRFDDEYRRRKVSSATGSKVCARRGCSNRFVPPKRRPGKKFCSDTCRSAAWKHPKLKTVPRGKGRVLEELVCRNGHPRTRENTSFTNRGTRYCLICHRAAAARWREENRRRKRGQHDG